jgi:hypothetical protein
VASRKYGLISQTPRDTSPREFNKIRVGRSLIKDDAFLDIDYLKPRQKRYKRRDIERAIDTQDIRKLREISEYFFYCSGIYERLCRYMAYIYRYD